MAEENKVSSTIAETPSRVRIGRFSLSVRPLNLLQVQEIADRVRRMQVDDGDGEETILTYTLERPNNLALATELSVVALFRERWKRRAFGWYVRKHLDSEAWRAVFNRILNDFDYGFFFRSLISLKGLTPSRTSTSGATARGESSET